MKLSSWQKQKLIALADYQDTLAFLYTVFSERLPAFQTFWLDMAVPKLKYADWIRSCSRKIEEGVYQYNMLRFKIESVMSGLDYLQASIRNARSGKVTQRDAVALAMALESGIITSRFYEIVDVGDIELLKLVEEFKSERIKGLGKLRNFSALRNVAQSQSA